MSLRNYLALPGVICLLRGVLPALLLLAVADRDQSYSFAELLLTLLLFAVLLRRVTAPFLNEIVLLERNPLRARHPQAMTARKRSILLHASNPGSLINLGLVTSCVAVLLTVAMFGTLLCVKGIFLDDWTLGSGHVRDRSTAFPVGYRGISGGGSFSGLSQSPHQQRGLGGRAAHAGGRKSPDGASDMNGLSAAIGCFLACCLVLRADDLDTGHGCRIVGARRREALRAKSDLPWYDADTDSLRRIEVTPDEDDLRRHSPWAVDQAANASGTTSSTSTSFWQFMQVLAWVVLGGLLAAVIWLLVWAARRMDGGSSVEAARRRPGRVGCAADGGPADRRSAVGP